MRTKKDSSASSAPDHDQISQRARELWERAGRPENRDLEYWLEAERQLAPGNGPRDDVRRFVSDPMNPVPPEAAEADDDLPRTGRQPPRRRPTSATL